MKTAIYMDYNASAPLRPKAMAAMLDALSQAGNASSVHAFGRSHRRRVEVAREQVAKLVGATAHDVIFTSGGSEANNLALANRGQRRLLVSAIEHDSILAPGEKAGAIRIAVDGDGLIDLDHLDRVLAADPRPSMISLMLANNETGVIQPATEAGKIAARHGAIFHCDATQAAGRIPIAMRELGADMLSLSAHKIGGPQGIGALVTRPGFAVTPQILGGGQERFRRAGTENVAAIAGFGAAAEEASDLRPMREIEAMRDRLEGSLLSANPAIRIFGANAPRLANTSCLAVAGKSAETLVMALDLSGYAISAGSACSSGKMRPSHVIQAMGFDVELARSAIRISLGIGNRPDEIDGFVSAFQDAVGRPQGDRDAA